MKTGTTIAFALCLALAGGMIVAGLKHHPQDNFTKASAPPPVVSKVPTAMLPPSSPSPVESGGFQVSGEPTVIPPLPANASHVPDGHLLKLSALVNLPNAEERRIDKEAWSRALPIARQLAQAPCDCEQRNWLNHFIEMGEDALSDSHEAYYHLAALMPKMARSDEQLAEDPGRINR